MDTDNTAATTTEAMFDEALPGKVDGVEKEPDDKLARRLSKIKGWWDYARSIQSQARLECLRDHEFYDGDQWRQEDKEAVEARGQIPTVFNRIKTTADWLIGSEKKSRIDYRVLPRTSEDSKGAEVKTQVLKYLSDVNKLPAERSHAFEDGVISGLGWLEVGVVSDPTQEPIFIDYEDWRNLWFDPLSVRLDLKDARFLIRRKRVDLDMACAMFPDRAGALRMQSKTAKDYGDADGVYDDDTDLEYQIESQGIDAGSVLSRGGRGRLDIVECWYKTPEKVQIFDGRTSSESLGTLKGQIYRADEPAHKELVESGHASVIDAIKMIVRCMIFTGNVILQDTESPYNHGRFPFVPIWGFRKKKDNTPYGIVRNLRDIQDDLNKRRSKALFVLSTNQVIADDDAVEDWDELADEVSRPDGIIKKKRGSELEIRSDRGLAQEHVNLMEQDAEYIEAAGGVTDEQMGRQTNATSGKAIEARQEQGNIVNSKLFYNLKESTQMLGEMLLSLVEQYYTDAKSIRITNEKNQVEFTQINSVDPETGESLNDITAAQADFIVDSSAWSASIRQATFETLMEMLTRMAPEVSIALLDLVVDMSDIPGKDDLVARIRMVNGMEDPDADPDDPEAMAAREAKAQVDEARNQAEQIMRDLEMRKLQSEVDKNNTDSAATAAGVSFDKEKLKIEKAKALHDIRSGNKTLEISEKTAMIKNKDKVPVTKQGEHGVKSDNKTKGK